MIDRIGKCVYCGQSAMVKVNENAEQGEVDEAATLICKCDEAKEFQKLNTSMNSAESYIKNRYTGAPDIQKLLLAAVRPVGMERMDKVSVTWGQSTYTLSKDSKGQVKVEKKTVIQEANTL